MKMKSKAPKRGATPTKVDHTDMGHMKSADKKKAKTSRAEVDPVKMCKSAMGYSGS